MTRIPIISDVVDKITGHKPEPPNNEMDIQAEMPMPDLGAMSSPQYGDQFFRFQQDNQQVESKESILKSIWEAKLSLRCKSAFTDLVNTYYDRNIILANLTPTKTLVSGGGSFGNIAEIAYLRLLIDKLATLKANSYKSDCMNPSYIKYSLLIQSQVWYRISRTTGNDRERIAGAKIMMSYDTNQKVSRSIGGNQR